MHPVLTFGECGHVDDPGVVGLELLEQLLRGHVPDKDVLPHTRYGSVLTLHSEEMAEYCTLYYTYLYPNICIFGTNLEQRRSLRSSLL